jgi:hypothetical protein
MNDLVKMANIAKVKANLAAGMPMMAAIQKAYPDYTPDQVKALAAQMGGMGKTASKGKATREALEEAMAKFLARGGRVRKMPKGKAQGSDSMTYQQVGNPRETIMVGGNPMSVSSSRIKIASYGKALKAGKAKKYIKKKLAHALMLKIANQYKAPPASMVTMPAPKPKAPKAPAEAPFMPPASAVTVPAPKPKAPKAPAGPGLRMTGKTTGRIVRGPDGTPMGPPGRPMMVGGGQPIYAKVKPKARPQPKMPVPPNNLKAQYVKN